jgi:NADH-quinone oxidoreductase subunit K
MSSLTLFFLASLILLVLGLIGLVTRRTLVGMLISVELMLNGAGLSLVAAAKSSAVKAAQVIGQEPVSPTYFDAHGQLSALFVMGLAAAEASLVLGMILVAKSRFGRVSAQEISTLRGDEGHDGH